MYGEGIHARIEVNGGPIVKDGLVGHQGFCSAFMIHEESHRVLHHVAGAFVRVAGEI